MERSREEIQEFVSDRIQQWLQDILGEDPNDPMQDTLSMLYSDILNNEMLLKEQAKLLERRLEDECKFLYHTTYNENSNYILHIDSLTIYVDAWAQYCRPGEYRV